MTRWSGLKGGCRASPNGGDRERTLQELQLRANASAVVLCCVRDQHQGLIADLIQLFSQNFEIRNKPRKPGRAAGKCL
jgi:hypothetical protein